MDAAARVGWQRRALALLALVVLAGAGLLLATTRFEIEGHWRGLYLLKARDGRMLELQDDLYLGDGSRLVAGLTFTAPRRWLGAGEPPAAPGQPSLALDWDERSGRGMVRNRLGDGRELLTMLGRYEDSDGGHPRGLFVGGAVPDVSADTRHQDQSGMALHDARGWIHVWCNVNEALVDADAPGGPRLTYPGDWRFLGSRVLLQDRQRVVLESNHEILLTRGRLRMDRFAWFTAGEPYFQLAIRLTALGPGTATYDYLYGDEPWVGHFGSSDDNLGWVEEGIVSIEGRIDPRTHRWAGIVDTRSRYADYLEWMGDDLPDDVYFSNTPGDWADASLKKPLKSDQVFVGLQWVRRKVAPGEGRTMRLAIGLAESDSPLGPPRRPRAAAAAWP